MVCCLTWMGVYVTDRSPKTLAAPLCYGISRSRHQHHPDILTLSPAAAAAAVVFGGIRNTLDPRVYLHGSGVIVC